MKHIGINLCEVGPIDCDTNAMSLCLDRDGGYDCECSTGNGTKVQYGPGARYTACAFRTRSPRANEG